MATIDLSKSAAEILSAVMREKKLIDLTLTIWENYPSWYSYGMPFIRARFGWYDNYRGPMYDNVLIIEEHTGTHCDAPPHMIPDPKENPDLPWAGPAGEMTVDKVPLTQVMGPACVIDVRDLLGTASPGMCPIIQLDRVKAWEERYGELKAGDVPLFYTSWTDLYYKPFPEGYKLDRDCRLLKKTQGWPAPSPEVIQYFVDKGIKHVGIDTVSMGPIQDDDPPHYVGLSRGLVFTEKLHRLGELPPRGAFYMWFPLKIGGGSGAPGRAIAIL